MQSYCILTLDGNCCICSVYENKPKVHICKKQNSRTFQFYKKMFQKVTNIQQLIFSVFFCSHQQSKNRLLLHSQPFKN